MLGISWGWGNGWALCCKHNQFETSGVDIQGISLVNLRTYNVSVMASCKCVAKIRRNLIVCVKIFAFFWKVFTNETCRHSDRLIAPCVLYLWTYPNLYVTMLGMKGWYMALHTLYAACNWCLSDRSMYFKVELFLVLFRMVKEWAVL